MSSLPVAAQQGRATPRMSLVIVVFALLAAAVIGAAVGAAISANRATTQTTAVTTSVQHPVSLPAGAIAVWQQAPPMTRYRQLVADLAAAEDQGAYREEAIFRGQLDSLLTPQLIGQIYQEHERLLEARVATGRDSHAGLITRQLMALCGADGVKARLSFCK